MTSALATPVDVPIDTTPGLLLLHVPPDTASVYVAVLPKHIAAPPVIAAGAGTTLITVCVKHPEASV